jgi:hypothetical protein
MPRRLVSLCSSAIKDGHDFPTIWERILKPHPMVRGVPIQAGPGLLEIRLITGQSIIYKTELKEFSLY